MCDADPAQFRTGWFVESLLTEVLVLFVLRTRGPVTGSRPSGLQAGLAAVVIAATLALPFTPLGPVLGFVAPPLSLIGLVLAITTGYVAATEWVKRWYFRVPAAR